MKKSCTIQLLQTSDVHGYVYPTSYSTKQEQSLGLAKLQTLIQSIRKPQSILIDTGDIIQGSPLTYYHAKKSSKQVHPMAIAINYMNYDYITIGNHEFNYGLGTLHQYTDHVQATILNANILDHSTQKPFTGVAYDIRTFDNGLKMAFIGVTTHYIPQWEQQEHIEGLLILDAFETTKQVVTELRASVDYIVVSYHGGFERNFTDFSLDVEDTGENQGSKMLQNIPEIDVLLTGHQHRHLSGIHNTTTYVQPGFNGNTLAEINITASFDGEWHFDTRATLHRVDTEVPDQTLLQLLQEDEQLTQHYLDTPVGFLDKDYSITNQLQARLDKHPLITYINDIQLQYTNADIACCSLGNEVSGFKQKITIRDIIGTYIYPNTIVVKEMRGSDLKQALEKTADFFTIIDGKIAINPDYNYPKLQLYAYDMYDPLKYTITVSKPVGSKVSNISLHGKPLDDYKTYKVAMNNYRASGGGDYLFIKDCPTIWDTQTEVIELLINTIVEQQHIKLPTTKNITIIP